MNNVVANGRGLRTIQHRPKRGHAALMKRTVKHDVEPSVNGDEWGPAKVRDDAAPHGGFAMAHRAKLIEQALSRRNLRRIRGVAWRIDDQLRFWRQSRQIALRTELEYQQSADVALIAGLVGL